MQVLLKRCSRIKYTDGDQTSGDDSFSSLYEDIIFGEVLPRLPVRSLLRFKCVSKSWCSLISSKAFAKTHFEFSRTNTNLTDQGVMLTYSERFYSVSHWSLRSLFYEPITEEFVLDVTSLSDNPGKKRAVHIVGSINGLCCVANAAQEFFIWNPCTRKIRKLCDIGVDRSYRLVAFGFGFVEAIDDYKVLAVLGNYFGDVVKLYSLKANNWKTIVGFEHASSSEIFHEKGEFLNGNLHWLCRSSAVKNRDFIMSFDLETEEQNIIELPSYVDEERRFNPTIGVLSGCLSFVCEDRRSCANVWVQKQYGVHKPWSKVASVPYISHPGYFPYSPTDSKCFPYFPLCVEETGEILFYYDPSFIVYNPKNNVCRYIQLNDDINITQVHTYTHSLLSP